MTIVEHYTRILFRILMPIISLLFCTIIIRRRVNITPLLLENKWWRFANKAGMEIAAAILSIIFAAIFGLATAFALNFFLSRKLEESESSKRILTRGEVTDLDFF